MRTFSFILSLVSLVSLAPNALQAQAAQAVQPPAVARFVLSGKVLDPAGGWVAGARVTSVRDSGGGAATGTGAGAGPSTVSGQSSVSDQSTVSDQYGAFQLALAPGVYTIKIAAPGFLEATEHVTATNGGAASRDIVLTVAGVRETVSVSAPAAYQASETSAGVLGDRSLVDTPFSVNVVTRQLMDTQQAASYGDFLKNDPSATTGNVPVGFSTLRGFSVGIDGYLYDGLIGNLGLSDGRWQLEGVERVEVLKGPSAFLNGLGASSSLGGTLNYVPKGPTDTPVRSVTLGYTGRSLFGVAADFGDRAGARRQFGYRVNLGYKDGEQAVDRYDWTHKAATVALDWRATPDLVISGGYEYASNHFPRLQPFFVLAPGLAVPAPPKASRNMAIDWDDFRVLAHSAHARADWKLAGGWSLTAQAMRSTNDRPRVKEARFGMIVDGRGNAQLFGGEDETANVANSGQALLRGTIATGRVRHQLTAGLSGFTNDARGSTVSLGVFDTNIYSPLQPAEPSVVSVAPALTQKSNGVGLLISDIVTLSERWSILAGGRYADLDVRNYDGATGLETTSHSTSKFAPTAAVMFKPASGALLYVNYAEGVEQGGQAPVGTTNANQMLPPIVTKQVEAGGKVARGHLTMTAALFDLQRPFEYVDPTTGTYVQNGDQWHRGVEFTATGRVAPDVTIVAGTMVLDAKTAHTGDPATEGRRPVGVAKVTANVYAEYHGAALRGWALHAGVYRSGVQYLDGANTQPVPAWTRIDAGARYETRVSGVRTTFLIGVENIANRNYWAGATGGLLTLAEPRTVKLTARVTF
jgi:iron complex outermembrane receptor protein